MGKNLKGKEIGKGLSQRENGKYSARFVLYNGKRISRCFESKINLKKDTPDEFRDIVFLNRKWLPTKNSAYDTHIYIKYVKNAEWELSRCTQLDIRLQRVV